jgi:hypothetical protein
MSHDKDQGTHDPETEQDTSSGGAPEEPDHRPPHA